MGDRNYNFDANLVLSDGSAVTADGYTTVGGSTATLDLGGNQSTSPTQQARIEMACVLEVSAIDTTSSDERYNIKILGSNDSAWASGNVVSLAEFSLGYGGAGVPTTLATSTTGEYEMFFATEQDDVKYQYIRMYVDVAGTTPSITFQAYCAVLP